MARAHDFLALIYEEDASEMCRFALKHPNIETGGDLFGLWQSESEAVIQLAIGPGKNCRRTTTAFYQDRDYLENVGRHLTSAEGLCNIGEWHSHHSLNLPEPSGGDKATVWRNMPQCGLKRFLLFIATISPQGKVDLNGFVFTAPKNGRQNGEMFPLRYRVLPGPNPFRNRRKVWEIMQDGAEDKVAKPPSLADDFPPSLADVESLSKKDKKKLKKKRKKEKKKRKKEEKKRKEEEKEDKKQENKSLKHQKKEEENKNKKRKPKQFFPSFKRNKTYDLEQATLSEARDVCSEGHALSSDDENAREAHSRKALVGRKEEYV